MRIRRDDRGSAVVEFVLVAPLVVLLAVVVVQAALVLHVRSVLISAAAEGARAGALAGADTAAGARRAIDLAERSVGASVVTGATSSRTRVGGLPAVEVRIEAAVPVVGPIGTVAMSVAGHALVESAQDPR